MAAQRNPEAMRNLPLVAYRLTHAQRTAAQAEAEARGLKLNEMAKQALLALVGGERVNADAGRVNTARVRELTIERDPVG